MAVVTSGRISVTPVVIKTTSTVSALHETMIESKYSPVVPNSGWGSQFDGDEFFELGVTARPVPFDPEVVPASEPYLEHLRARFYWDRQDPRVFKLMGADAPKSKLWTLEAADIVIVDSAFEGLKVAYVGAGHQSRELRMELEPALLKLCQTTDPSASIPVDSDIVGFGTDDFFRWIVTEF